MTQTQTDLATVTTAVENIYNHAGPAVTFEGQAMTDLQESPPDVASAITALQSAETHVAYIAFQAATAQQGATALASDLAASVAPPPPPPPPAGKPLWAEYHGNTSDPNSTVPIGAILDYGDNNAQSYTWTVARVNYMKGRLPIIKMEL